MKLAWILGLVCAVLVHAGILLFGGYFFMDKKKDAGTTQTVDLLSDLEAEHKKEKKPEETKDAKKEELDQDKEEPPDAAEIMRTLDASPVDSAPALEAASLSAIEAALSGAAGGGDFGESVNFSSGGVIGGKGIVGGTKEQMDDAFSMAEIDQKPRAMMQESPLYPAEMRGKNVEGVVTLLFVVDSTGKVVNPRVEKSSQPAFDSPALNAIKKWKFEAGVRAGQHVASKMRITIRFPAE